MSIALQVLAVGIGTYLLRVSAIAVVARAPQPSEATDATMRLIAPAVLAAIVADQLFVRSGSVTLRWAWLIAAAIAILVAYRWRSAGVTMLVGVVAAWLLDAALSST
ncbi:MAG: AzlD domain-containing protein [Actinomycetota bacterium]